MRLPRTVAQAGVALIALTSFAVSLFAAPATTGRSAVSSGEDLARAHQHVVDYLEKAPIVFERNEGQFPKQFDYMSRADGQAFFVNATGARVIAGGGEKTQPVQIGLRLAGACEDATKSGGDVATITNYVYGNDRTKWRMGIASYNSVRYDDVYPGIDVEYHARRGMLEYDFVVAPGADLRAIALQFEGTTPVLDENGDLVLRVGATEIRHRAPYTYQEIGGTKQLVESRYDLVDGKVAFAVGEYDPKLPLVIDPTIDFSRVIQPLAGLLPRRIEILGGGDILIAGEVWGQAAAVAGGLPAVKGSRDFTITRIDPIAQNVRFTTYFGGFLTETNAVMTVDASGNVYVAGTTASGDFPTTTGVLGEYTAPVALLSQNAESRAVVSKFDGTSGAMIWSTYLEDRRKGSTNGTRVFDVAVDAGGNVIVSGDTLSNNYPVTPGAFSEEPAHDPSNVLRDPFLSKLAPDGRSFVFSTYGLPAGVLLVDASNNIYLGLGRLLTKVDPAGNVLLLKEITSFATAVADMAFDGSGNIVGVSSASGVASLSPPSYQRQVNGEIDVFVWKLNAAGTTVTASTFYGGSLEDYPSFVAIGPDNSIFVAGSTGSDNIPLAQAFQSGPFDGTPYPPDGPKDLFIARFDSQLTQLMFGTYFGPAPYVGGFDLDAGGNPIFATAAGGLATWLRGPQPKFAVVEGDSIVARVIMSGTPAGFSVDSLIPSAIEVGQGGNIDIRGHGFVQPVRVFFGTQETFQNRIVVWGGGTRILAPVPDRNLPELVNIKIVNGNGQEIVLPGAFTFLEPQAQLSNTIPARVPSIGGTITLQGSFIPEEAPTVLYRTSFVFDYSVGTNVMPSPPHSLTFTMAPVPRTSAQAEFRILPFRGDAFINRLLQAFIEPSPFPVVTSVQPASGSVAGGTQITISGQNFHPLSRVVVGDVYAKNVIYLNSSGLSATLPPNSGGVKRVTVVNPDHGAASLNNAFTYRGITAVTPAVGSVAGGTSVGITGYGFTGATSVTFGGVGATSFTVVNDTTINAVTPAHAAGFVDVNVVAGAENYLLPAAFRYMEPAPTISNITPSSGPAAGNTAVTINGSGFLPGIEVFIGAEAVNVNVVSGTQLTAVTAPGIPGLTDVTVRNSDGQDATLADAYTYRGIATIDPPAALAGASVNIIGAGFLAGATVTFDNVAATANVVSGTSITATVPAHAPGLVNVVVTNPGGETFTFNGFRILPPAPTITSFTPTSGLPGTPVTITGTDFEFVEDVRFNNVPATFTVDSTTQITAQVPVTTAAVAPIKVTTASGTGTSATDFTIENAAAEITSFSPAMGGTGTAVVITGIKFNGATAVKFGTIAAPSFTVDSTTQITAIAPANGITAPICIETPGPFSGCSATNFIFPPRVTSFTPATGQPGTVVTVTGVNMQNPTGVTFNGATASVFSSNPAGTELTVTVPNDASTGLIVVSTAAGDAASATSFGVPPAITSFSPLKTGVGNEVTITGLRFLGVTAVAFNGTQATTFSVVNATTIKANVPVNATTGFITVTAPGGTATSADPFEVADTPVVLSFSPTKGGPGTVVTINGSDMDTATSVKFNGVSASFTIINPTQLTATVPNTATNGLISVGSAEGSGVSAQIFSLPPTLSSFAPSSGGPGTVVTISGINFLGTTAVSFGATAATFTVVSNDQITTTVPNGATTNVIKVTTGYGTVQSAFNFTVLSGSWPSVTAVATGSNTIMVTWTGSASHTYQVRRIARKTDSFPAGVIATVTGNAFVDNTAAAGTTYLYNIYDVTTGQIGNHDYATTVIFTDDPLAAGMYVKSSHIVQLRTAVNAMRYAAGLSPATFTDGSLSGLRIKTLHISQLRTALTEALVSLGRYAEYTNPTLSSGAPIRVPHVHELREAVK